VTSPPAAPGGPPARAFGAPADPAVPGGPPLGAPGAPGGPPVPTALGPMALSGRAASGLTVEAVRAGDVTLPDTRIHPDVLRHQAHVAVAHANPQLAANLRRAAELTGLDDDEVLALYDRLRPGRSTPEELRHLAGDLAARSLDATAELFREAAAVYARRGLGRR
jgi:propanediol dehydratase small subunit